MVQIFKAIRVFHPCSNAILRATYFIHSYTVLNRSLFTTFYVSLSRHKTPTFHEKKKTYFSIHFSRERKREEKNKFFFSFDWLPWNLNLFTNNFHSAVSKQRNYENLLAILFMRWCLNIFLFCADYTTYQR